MKYSNVFLQHTFTLTLTIENVSKTVTEFAHRTGQLKKSFPFFKFSYLWQEKIYFKQRKMFLDFLRNSSLPPNFFFECEIAFNSDLKSKFSLCSGFLLLWGCSLFLHVPSETEALYINLVDQVRRRSLGTTRNPPSLCFESWPSLEMKDSQVIFEIHLKHTNILFAESEILE